MPELQYHIETFGCQMNVYDSELIANQLIKTGYTETKSIENQVTSSLSKILQKS